MAGSDNGGAHDLFVDVIEEVNGKYVVFNSSNPATKHPINCLLDGEGEETEDLDTASGGLIEYAGRFIPFWFAKE